MTAKTNKSYLKRLKITKTGKILGRKPGKCHFNAKSSRSKQLNAKRYVPFGLKQGDLARYLPHNQ